MATRTITRYSSDVLNNSQLVENGQAKDQHLLTIPASVLYAQLVDIRILYDTSEYGDLHNLRFGLWAVDGSGNKIASFYPKNYIIETYNTQFYTAFEHYIQLPAGASIYWCAMLDDQTQGKDYNVCVNATLETYA